MKAKRSSGLRPIRRSTRLSVSFNWVLASLSAALASVRNQQGKVEIGPPGTEFAPGPLPPSGILFRTGASDTVIQTLVETLVDIREFLAGSAAQGGPTQLNPNR